MKDFINQELQINDSVVLESPYYSELVLGRVIKFTKQKIKVCCFTRHSVIKEKYEELTRFPEQIVRIGGPELTEHIPKKRLLQIIKN